MQHCAAPATKDLQLIEHELGARHLEIAGRFDVELFDNAIVDHHRETLAALAHPETGGIHGEADCLDEVGIAGVEVDLTITYPNGDTVTVTTVTGDRTTDVNGDAIIGDRHPAIPGLVLTIDDADRSVYELASPLLREYGVRAHLFVPTGQVASRWSGIEVCGWAELREMADSGVVLLGSHTHDLHYKVGTDRGRQPVFWNPDRIGEGRSGIIYRAEHVALRTRLALKLVHHQLRQDDFVDEIRNLIKGAFVHDVGKIAISDSILLKPGRLTCEEFEVMKTHTEIGARILSGSNFPLLQVARRLVEAPSVRSLFFDHQETVLPLHQGSDRDLGAEIHDRA